MKNHWQVIFSFLLIFLITQTTLAQENIVIRGKVSDDNTGHPLAGATLVLKGPEIFAATVTDLDGNYEFKIFTPGKYRLNIEHTGYVSKKIKNIPLETGISWVFNFELSEESKDKGNETERINFEKLIKMYHDDAQKL